MATARPFEMVEQLFKKAAHIWFALAHTDRLDAFAAEKQSRKMSEIEPREKKKSKQLDEANRLYENKFGFIFIVYSGGKQIDEILAICKARIGNTPETELQIAAEDYFKIIETRLNKLLEK